jgi:hypothetical protein
MTIKRIKRTPAQIWVELAKKWLDEARKWIDQKEFDLFDYAMMKFRQCRDLSEVE